MFQPYEEDLPLQSGFYTFVIDRCGEFRVKWGNTSSHASFVDRQEVLGAGSFRIERSGKLAQVICSSYDYRIRYVNHVDRRVSYIVQAFNAHSAFEVSDHAIFTFSKAVGESFSVDHLGNPIDEQEYRRLLELLDSEGVEPILHSSFTPIQVASFIKYKPAPPSLSYPIRRDQSITALEEDGDVEIVCRGDAAPRFSIDDPVIPTGKVNFVIDKEGWLILGTKHHHILSGGGDVGGAGHLLLDPAGRIDDIQLNFSGHYRPPLSADYVRYVYRTVTRHPLLTIKADCKVRGRKFDEESYQSTLISFDASELETDDPSLEEYLEMHLL